MEKEELVELFEPDADAVSLLSDICEFVMPKKGEKAFEAISDIHSAPLDAFADAYKNPHLYESYNNLRVTALLKLIYTANVDKGLIKGREYTMRNSHVYTIRDVLRHIINNFEVFSFEKLFLFRVTKRGGITCVYESKSNEKNSCFMKTDELTSILSRNDGAAFIMVHSHPEGDFDVSSDDIFAHKYVKRIFSITKCQLIEHIVIGSFSGKAKYITLDRKAEYYEGKRLSDLIE